MRVALRFDGRRPRRWHGALARVIAALPDHAVALDDRPGPEEWPGNAELLFRLEALIHRLPRTGLSAPPERGIRIARVGEARQADLVLDLCGDVPLDGPVPVWRLTYDGAPGETALLASLLDGRWPLAALKDRERVRCAGRLGTELRGTILTSFEDALARTLDLIVSAVKGPGPQLAATVEPLPSRDLSRADVALRMAKALPRRIAGHLYRLAYHGQHWRVGWRHLDGPDLIDLRRHPPSGWQVLPDDGMRFYADPISIVHRGRHVLFVEDFIHATGKAVISAVTIGPDGPAGRPEPVLEEPHHLSYPFVFEADGEAWMVPESSGAGTIDLYRARAFPGGWVKEAVLVSDVCAGDATLVQHGGSWWMFASVRGAPADAPLGSGSFSDALHLWSAPDFRGPWTAHPHNPVVIDIGSARPAGRIVERQGRLIRPVQDCRTGYGGALALARIDRLDGQGYAQSVETILSPGPLWAGGRLHTLDAAGGFEFIDGAVPVRRRG